MRLLHFTFGCVLALWVTAAVKSAVGRVSVLVHLPHSLEDIPMAGTANIVEEVMSLFRSGPAYRYIRRTDHLPTDA
jgi:hypothetical protein